MEEENTQQEIKSQRGEEIGTLPLMYREIEETEVYPRKLKDLLGHQMKGTIPEEDHTKEDMIPMIDQVMRDRMTVDEEGVAIGRTIDRFAQGDMREGVEDMLHVETGAGMTEDEEDTIGGIPEVMIEEVEVGMTEVVTEVTQGVILEEAMEAIPEVTHLEVNEGTQGDMIVDTAEVVVMNLEEVDIEVVEGTMVHEITRLLEVAATIGQESILHLADIQVTDHVMTTEVLLAAILEEVMPEVGVIVPEMKIGVDMHRDEIILHRIVMMAEGHHLEHHSIVLLVDIVVARRLKDLTDMGTYYTNFNTEYR